MMTPQRYALLLMTFKLAYVEESRNKKPKLEKVRTLMKQYGHSFDVTDGEIDEFLQTPPLDVFAIPFVAEDEEDDEEEDLNFPDD